MCECRGLFSATQTKEVKELIRAGMRNPVYVKVCSRAPLPSSFNLLHDGAFTNVDFTLQVQVENKLTSALQKIPSTYVLSAQVYTCMPF